MFLKIIVQGYEGKIDKRYDIRDLTIEELESQYTSILGVFDNIDNIQLTVEGLKGDDLLSVKVIQGGENFNVTIETKQKRKKITIDKADFKYLDTIKYLKLGYDILISLNHVADKIESVI